MFLHTAEGAWLGSAIVRLGTTATDRSNATTARAQSEAALQGRLEELLAGMDVPHSQ